MNPRYNQLPNEDTYEWGLRLIEILKEEKPDDFEWSDIIEILGLKLHRESLRKANDTDLGGYSVHKYYQKKVDELHKYYQNKLNGKIEDKDIANEVENKQREIQKERMKLQTENIENRRLLREQSRLELYEEKMHNAIKSLKPLEIPEHIYPTENIKVGILTIADAHYGAKFTIKGLKGEILNEYSIEIFEDRMWQLFNEVIAIIDKENIQKLYIYNLSDSIENLMHLGQLRSLEVGVIESLMGFAEFMANWLNELSRYCLLEYISVCGNHTELRIFNAKANDLPNENGEKIITWFIANRLENNPNIIIHKDISKFAFDEIMGLRVMAVHGQDEKNLEQSIKDYSLMYGEQIDLLLSGHLHTSHNKSIGMTTNGDVEFVQSDSIMGCNPYSASIKKVSKPGSKLLIIEEGKGKTITYNIKLR